MSAHDDDICAWCIDADEACVLLTQELQEQDAIDREDTRRKEED